MNTHRQLVVIAVMFLVTAGTSHVHSAPSRALPADTPNEVRAEIDHLFAKDSLTRGYAACNLSLMGPKAGAAVPMLAGMLDDHETFKWPVVDKPGVSVGRDCAGHAVDPSTPADQASAALLAIGEPAVLPLIQKLTDGSARVRAHAVYVLSRISDPRAIEPLIAAFADRDAEVRSVAARWIRYTDPRMLDPYIAALKDSDPVIRRFAVSALGRFKEPRAVQALISTLTDTDTDVRWFSLLALSAMKDPAAMPAVLPVVKAVLPALKDESRVVRSHAAYTLGVLGQMEAFEPLLLTATTDPDQAPRYVAWEALAALGNARAAEPLIAALASKDSMERSHAAKALGTLRDPRAIEPLKALLNDEERWLRRDAEAALKAIAGEP